MSGTAKATGAGTSTVRLGWRLGRIILRVFQAGRWQIGAGRRSITDLSPRLLRDIGLTERDARRLLGRSVDPDAR